MPVIVGRAQNGSRVEPTCNTLSARRISPRVSLSNAAFPSSVRLHLSSALVDKATHFSFSTTSSTFRSTSFSGKGLNLNLVHLDCIAGAILLT